MSSDIVERLRRITARPLGLVLDPPPHPLCKEAADAIEARDAEIKRLRAAGDALAEVVDEWPELVAAWEEACRG